MEQHLKTCFYFKANVYALKITLGDMIYFFGLWNSFFAFNVGGWNKKITRVIPVH